MKLIIKLVVAVVLVLLVVYYVGGYEGFDATKQGRDARAAIGPGMSWKQAFDITGDPREYRPIIKTTRRIGPETFDTYEPGPRNKFRRATVETRLAENTLPHGFICTFTYSGAVAFTVKFDNSGTVIGVTDAITMADLLQLKDE